MEPDSHVALIVRRFERDASPDDWVSLMGAASCDTDPGKAYLQRMVQWALGRVDANRFEAINASG